MVRYRFQDRRRGPLIMDEPDIMPLVEETVAAKKAA